MITIKCIKIGNSAGFRIPQKFLFKANGIEIGNKVILSVKRNKIVIEKINSKKEKDTK